jgi:hypothetical protein
MSKKRRTEKAVERGGAYKIKHTRGTGQQPHGPFTIREVSGIEIATARRNAGDLVPDGGLEQIAVLSEIASRRFAEDGRGAFLVVSESDPRAAAYLPLPKLAECIEVLIPEAANEVESAVKGYDPSSQFVMVNVVNRRRIAITIDSMRSLPDQRQVP